MKVITGGAGFIGTNLAEYFLKKNEEILILDDFSRKGTKENKKYLEKKYSKKLKIIKCDISRNKALEKNLSQAEAVYHLAGQTAVTQSIKNPKKDFEINAKGTLNVLEAVRKNKNNPVLIFSSTNKVYGKLEQIRLIKKKTRFEYKNIKGINEETCLDFFSPYGCSKGSADQYTRDYSRIYGLNSVVFRQSCIYGKRQFGIEDQGWIAWFIIAVLLGKKLTVYGNGKQVRDVLYVEDLSKAYYLAEKKIKKTKGKVFNIGGGPKNTVSLLEAISLIEEILEKKINYSFSKERPGDQKVFVSDISKAKKVFGWVPETDSKKGIKIVADWIKENQKEIKKLNLF